ncbi:MAG: helicase-related protein [Bacilli bacterium]
MDLSMLKGVGVKKKESLALIGITSVEQLLHYYPYKVNFYDYTNLYEKKVIIKVKVVNKSNVRYIRNNLKMFSFSGLYQGSELKFTVFNQIFLHKYIIVGTEVSVICSMFKNNFTVERIIFDNKIPFVDVKYRSKKGIKSDEVKRLIMQSLIDYHYLLDNLLDNKLMNKYKLLDIKEAVYLIHKPLTVTDYNNAVRTLKYYEAYNFMSFLKENRTSNLEYDFSYVELENNRKFVDNLPYELTISQQEVVNDIYDDINRSLRIRRLIHGDVGCGKTIISIICAQMFTAQSRQVAILCPTQILAKQMFENYAKYLGGGLLFDNGLKKQERESALQQIANNEVSFVVGTHSILNDNIKFYNLALIVIDEQHKFGVEQREKLIRKQEDTNVILMSATPIPRTMGLVLFDNLNLSPIKTLPRNRKSVETIYDDKLTSEIITDIRNEIIKGNLVYAVAPMIDESENSNYSVEKIYAEYTKLFGKKDIGVLHGKLSSDEQENIIKEFKGGKKKILICTTIIEVGVDIPNASRILIHGASRFGLATLHQLRGRVGRSEINAKCYIIDNTLTERLEIIVKSRDGFEISEADFQLRGPGNLAGNVQSGYDGFKLIDVFSDINILKAAKDDVM